MLRDHPVFVFLVLVPMAFGLFAFLCVIATTFILNGFAKAVGEMTPEEKKTAKKQWWKTWKFIRRKPELQQAIVKTIEPHSALGAAVFKAVVEK